jgi:hypothetical protein
MNFLQLFIEFSWVCISLFRPFLIYLKGGKILDGEEEIIAGITARSVLEFSGILWNYLELLLGFQKNCIKVHWNSWNFCGIPGITMEFWNSIRKSWDYHTMKNFNYFPLVGW